jgi:hypothetical protein
VHGFSTRPKIASGARRSFHQQFSGFSVQDLFDQKRSKISQQWLLLSNFDPLFFLENIHLLDDGSKLDGVLPQIERRFFPICREEALLGSNFAILYEKLGQPDLAAASRQRLASLQSLPRHQEGLPHRVNLLGRVLQIGAMPSIEEAIRAGHPQSHTAIAINLNELKSLARFDQIFLFAHKSPPSQFTSLLVAEGQALINQIEPSIKKTVYSDHDLDLFFSHIDKKPVIDPHHIIRFFQELLKQKQITSGQFHRSLQRLVSEGMVAKEAAVPLFSQEEDSFELIQECLERHMNKSSSIYCYFPEEDTKFEDERFLNEIIENPGIDYHEEVQMLAGRKFLLATITKTAT